MRFLLTDIEKRRFIDFLEQTIIDNRELIKQMEKLGGPLDLLIKERKREMGAALIIANLLGSGEKVEIP